MGEGWGEGGGGSLRGRVGGGSSRVGGREGERGGVGGGREGEGWGGRELGGGRGREVEGREGEGEEGGGRWRGGREKVRKKELSGSPFPWHPTYMTWFPGFVLQGCPGSISISHTVPVVVACCLFEGARSWDQLHGHLANSGHDLTMQL